MTDKKEIKEQYKDDYIALQKQWKQKDQELFLVGKLAYWTYFISKYAEDIEDQKQKNQLFSLKQDAILLLSKSDYTQIRCYIPELHKKLCYTHTIQMRKWNHKPYWFLKRYREIILSCPKCQEGKDHYYSLYSLGILTGKKDEKDKKLLFALYSPYPRLKEEFPPIKNLEAVKFYRGREFGTIRVSNEDNRTPKNVFDLALIVKKFKENYKHLDDYLSKKL